MFKYNQKYEGKEDNSYYSCEWIENGLVFFKYKITMCCHCGHEGGGHVLLRENYDGKPLNLDRIFWLKNKFREFHKKGKIHTNCVGCPQLQLKQWNHNKDTINNLYISHWTDCNSKCIYCYQTQHPEEFTHHKSYSILPILKEMLKKKILTPGANIHFGGGEPTILHEFDDILKLLLDKKFYNLRVHTSGIKFSKMVERGVKEGKLYVVVSTDAGFKETYEKIKQVPCFDRVRENIAKYSKAKKYKTIKFSNEYATDGKLNVSSKFIIIPGINDTIEEIDSWFDANIKAKLCTTVIDIEEDWYKANKNNIPQRIYELIDYIKKRSDELNTNFELYERIDVMLNDRHKE